MYTPNVLTELTNDRGCSFLCCCHNGFEYCLRTSSKLVKLKHTHRSMRKERKGEIVGGRGGGGSVMQL